MNRSAAMMDLGFYRDAEPLLEEAKRLVQILEERDTLALLDISDGQREMGLGRWNRAVRLWERGLHELKRLGDLGDYARALVYVGRFYLEKGDRDESLPILQEAEKITRSLGDTTLTATIEGLLRRAEALGPPSASSRTLAD